MTKRTFNVAILGATGLVGEMLLKVLEERDFPVGEQSCLQARRRVGLTA